MIFCHKLDVAPNLLAARVSKPDVYPYLLASKLSGNQTSRYSTWMAIFQGLVTQNGDEGDCLQTIDISPCRRAPVDYSVALMAALS